MATAKAAQATSVASPSAEAGAGVSVDAPSRREFLYYIWGASIAMMLGQYTAIGLWFAFPRFREGEFGGTFVFDPANLPPIGAAPSWIAEGRYHVSNTERGIYALYGVCTHLGCLPKWVATNDRFECPCHGSKFQATGSYIEGPAPRGLDRFPVTVTYQDGSTASTPEDGGPIALDPNLVISEIRIDTGSKITGPPHGEEP